MGSIANHFLYMTESSVLFLQKGNPAISTAFVEGIFSSSGERFGIFVEN